MDETLNQFAAVKLYAMKIFSAHYWSIGLLILYWILNKLNSKLLLDYKIVSEYLKVLSKIKISFSLARNTERLTSFRNRRHILHKSEEM